MKTLAITSGHLDETGRIKRLGDKFHALSKDEAVEAKAAIGKRLPAYSSNWREAV